MEIAELNKKCINTYFIYLLAIARRLLIFVGNSIPKTFNRNDKVNFKIYAKYFISKQTIGCRTETEFDEIVSH